MTNTYASGDIVHADAGGLFGTIPNDAGQIEVKYSVYSSGGATGIAGSGVGNIDINIGNTDDLTSITGNCTPSMETKSV